jgi:hypothetical protein
MDVSSFSFIVACRFTGKFLISKSYLGKFILQRPNNKLEEKLDLEVLTNRNTSVDTLLKNLNISVKFFFIEIFLRIFRVKNRIKTSLYLCYKLCKFNLKTHF